MTGGTIVVLGEVGDNFGAGMTGGMGFVYDPEKARYGPEALLVMRLGGLVTVLGLGGFLMVLRRRDRLNSVSENDDSMDSQREQEK